MRLINRFKVIRKVANIVFTPAMAWFTVPLSVFFIVGGIGLCIFEKGDIVLALNKVSNPALDWFFLKLTNVGLGSFLSIAGVALALYNYRWSLLVLINLAVTGVFTNLFKRILYKLEPRPLHYFYYDDFTRFLYDAPITYYYSFPSGHTMAIYAACSLVAVLSNRKCLGLVFFLIALFTGFSRIYLLQHFFIDTYFGALLGVIATFITILIDKKLKLGEKAFAGKGLLKRRQVVRPTS